MVRVHLLSPGIRGVSEPMPSEEARAWAKATLKLFPGLRTRIVQCEAGSEQAANAAGSQ
jgi:hypothetical protein